jgi:hypothetical protein
MTTLPPEPSGVPAAGAPAAGDPVQQLHTQRQVAEGFGADAARYDRARPSYPVDLIDWILAASPGRGVLDVEVAKVEDWDPAGRPVSNPAG